MHYRVLRLKSRLPLGPRRSLIFTIHLQIPTQCRYMPAPLGMIKAGAVEPAFFKPNISARDEAAGVGAGGKTSLCSPVQLFLAPSLSTCVHICEKCCSAVRSFFCYTFPFFFLSLIFAQSLVLPRTFFLLVFEFALVEFQGSQPLLFFLSWVGNTTPQMEQLAQPKINSVDLAGSKFLTYTFSQNTQNESSHVNRSPPDGRQCRTRFRNMVMYAHFQLFHNQMIL